MENLYRGFPDFDFGNNKDDDDNDDDDDDDDEFHDVSQVAENFSLFYILALLTCVVNKRILQPVRAILLFELHLLLFNTLHVTHGINTFTR